jgi:hypothetical protein
MSDIFAKIDPMTMGEDYRSNLIAGEYAARLNITAGNLRMGRELDALDMLLNGYPSHRFVIDRKEATNLFHRVSPPTARMIKLAERLGTDTLMPRNQNRDETPRLEFLNDEASHRATAQASTRGQAARPPANAGGEGAKNVSRSVSTGSEQEPRRKSAA